MRLSFLRFKVLKYWRVIGQLAATRLASPAEEVGGREQSPAAQMKHGQRKESRLP